MKTFTTSRRLLGSLAVLAATTPALAISVQVTIENLAPANGTFLTPVWVGFHDGSFDLYNSGEAASMALERIAEDGNTAPLNAAFLAAMPSGVDGVIANGGPIAPGATVSAVFNLDAGSGHHRYFSYASMIIPSNDAFIANGNPMAFSVFDGGGTFQPVSFVVNGGMVLDAGTEVNDELPANTAFFGQMTPNTGMIQGGVVGTHPGFLPAGSGGILDAAMFANADFKAQGYEIARITITQVPEPEETAVVAAAALGAGAWFLRRRRAGGPRSEGAHAL